MTFPCIFLPDENVQGCLVERERRFREHRPDLRPWEKNPCESCKKGRSRAEAHIPPEPDQEDPLPKKMTTKEKVLALVQRRESASPTILMQVCHVSADELKAIVGELEGEGEIKSWPYRGRSGMTAIYTMPEAKDPRTKEMLDGKPSVAAKKPVKVKAAPVALTAPRKVPANGSGSLASVIAELERRRTEALDTVERIDTAIATLRSLA